MHEDDRFTAAELEAYRAGYYMALRVALKALAAAGHRFELRERTKRLAARQKRTQPDR